MMVCERDDFLDCTHLLVITYFFFVCRREGTHTECQYNLMTFGVPVQSFPITCEGDIKWAFHIKWIGKRRAKDARLKQGEVYGGIDLPGHNDVLLGRGKPFHGHPGNVHLRHLVDLHKDEYKMARVGEKHNITRKIVESVKRNSGTFLKREPDGWWVVVSDDEATEKVGHNFRTARSIKTKERQSIRYVEMKDRKRLRIQQRADLPCFTFPCCGGA
jgi:hypothetical protein